MKTCLLIYRHEWCLFTRNRMQLLILAIYTIATVYAIYYGNAEITRQQNNIQHIKQQNTKEQAALIKGLSADTATPEGMAAYEKAAYPSKVRFYLNHYAINEPSALAKLSIGQRDVNPYYLPLNAQNLYLQLFRSEISNPRKLLAGNFDLSFVVIYLLPLLIIAFTYNLLSEEKERGTYPMLKTQPITMRRVILYKGIFWFVITSAILLAVSVIAFVASGVREMAIMGWWLLITLLYAICWFSAILLVNAFNRSSAFNAIWSLGLWLLFLIIVPAVLNLAITDERQVDPTKLTDFIRRRQGIGETKQEKLALLDRFYKLYPQYANTDATGNYAFLDFQAYSAFVTLLDRESKPSVDDYYQQVWDRNEAIAAFNLINPAVNTQNLLNALSRTGLENAFEYRQSIAAFHAQISHFCFVPLFAGKMMTAADYNQIPEYKMQEVYAIQPILLKGMGWLLLLSIILFTIANGRLRKL